MASDWTTDKAEIPPSGERQDMTLSDMGFDRNRKPSDAGADKIVVRAVIDNGDYEGFRVSMGFLSPSVNPDFRELLNAARIIDAQWALGAIDPARCVKIIKGNFEKEARFSAVVHVNEIETESERVAKYVLREFGEPRHEPDLILQSEPQQFNRDV